MNPAGNRRRGKDAERALARRINGRRTGVLGGEDISHPLLSIEVKSRARFVGERFMAQAKRHSSGKIPAVIIHILNKPHGQDLVMLELKDFEDLFGSFRKGE
ncbi:MAG: hypothetical protein HZB85_06140 [Deltaproteobacteria bacterium]|nr:hypothetical protein [Deltaproteobacteria bacterium]